MRNTPLLIILLFFSIAAPKIGINFQFVDIVIPTGWGDIRMTNAFAGAVVGMTLYTAVRSSARRCARASTPYR